MSTVEMNSEEFYSIGHGFGLQELSLLHYIIINQKQPDLLLLLLLVLPVT